MIDLEKRTSDIRFWAECMLFCFCPCLEKISVEKLICRFLYIKPFSTKSQWSCTNPGENDKETWRPGPSVPQCPFVFYVEKARFWTFTQIVHVIQEGQRMQLPFYLISSLRSRRLVADGKASGKQNTKQYVLVKNEADLEVPSWSSNTYYFCHMTGVLMISRNKLARRTNCGNYDIGT